MSTTTTDAPTQPICERCGDPARHFHLPLPCNRFDRGEHLCDACARNEGAEANGAALAALRMLALSVELLRGDGELSDAQIRRAFAEVLADGGESITLYGPMPGEDVLGPGNRSDRPWARVLAPLPGAAGSEA